MLRVGLTGSIAVGKSFVSSVLAESGCHLLDADQTARAVVAPGSAGLGAVADAFGREVLRADGTLDRAKLGALVFSDATRREQLNAILHPLIIEEQDAWLRRCEAVDPDGVGVIDAALMIETGSYKRFDKLIVVHCRPELQLERLVKRDGLTPADAARRIAAQMPQEDKKRLADYLIDTSDGFDDTRMQTRAVYENLKSLATKN